ncbi:MAG TPA: bifunctional lysylphosphatidylglycerol flippase/synthetase MprF [Pseudomonadales bacterium]|nr:bifunctional lysylphosphatidylglycerol flippase/synthetase MprF [Pseudomonadales bacterium]
MKFRQVFTVLPLLAVAAALYLAHHEMRDYSIARLTSLVFSFPNPVLFSALMLTVAGYLVLAGYDWIALRHVGKQLPAWQVLLAGFTSFAVSNTAGHALVSGGSLRYRFYSGWGLNSLEIAQVILLSTVTYFLANGTLLVAGYLLTPHRYFDTRHMAGTSLHVVMWIVMPLLAGYWALVLSGKRNFTWRDHTVTLPGPGITLMQSVVGVVDLLLAASVLYLLLRQHMHISFGVFLNAYLLAQVIGLFSQSPGGIGVFEGVFMYLFTGHQTSEHVLAALIVYRVIYFLLPLLVASALIVVHEFWQRDALRRSVAAPWLALQHSLPYLYSLMMLVGGSMLLLSGVTPAEADRMDWLDDMLPVPLIETAHLMASMTGVLLLVVARAVRLKLRSAYYITLILLVMGAMASLLKGGDYEEASVLVVMLLLLLPAKKSFYRLSRLDQAGLTTHWILGIIAIVGVATWLGFFSYREVEYSHSLWWKFELHSDASRFLRVTFACVMLSGALFAFFFLRRSLYRPHMPDAEEMVLADRLVRQSRDSNHFLALTGDKHFFWNDRRTAFVSYVTSSKYWIVIGDPCGDDEACDEVLWQLREAADRFGAKLVFYRVRPEMLPMYLDLGLTMVKLGEEAIVDLTAFSLTGKSRASLRHAYNKMQREGWDFRVVSRDGVAEIFEKLSLISSDWLQAKNTREKGISLGFFDRDYLLRSDVAIITREDRIVAFANLWKPDNKEEISIDLMRYSQDAPNGSMEYLTICLMLWAREQGYQSFNLGMAPLSGLEYHTLAPLWHKIGSSVFRYGNEFYNFQGLRAYKDKFDPEWVPRYLAVPSSLDVPAVLLQVTSLIAGGVKGIFSK